MILIVILLENDVDIAVFQTLSENDLKSIGIESFGARRKLSLLVQRMKKTTPIETLEQAAPSPFATMPVEIIQDEVSY